MFSNDEKEFLRDMVKRELEHFKKEQKIPGDLEASVRFFKAAHEYGHFLEQLLAKLK
ncbi:Uncharacterised protein [uncultured archaeon]|nr:Uncharacterised protein [uncultured archaeon]